MQSDIERVLFDAPAIHKRLEEMAAQITADYSDRELTVIAILTGSLMFMSEENHWQHTGIGWKATYDKVSLRATPLAKVLRAPCVVNL